MVLIDIPSGAALAPLSILRNLHKTKMAANMPIFCNKVYRLVLPCQNVMFIFCTNGPRYQKNVYIYLLEHVCYHFPHLHKSNMADIFGNNLQVDSYRTKDMCRLFITMS